MCFDNDADWYASVSSDRRVVATKPSWCEECGCRIKAWQLHRYVYMAEYEDVVQWMDATGNDDPRDFKSEEFECRICLDCQAILDAIKATELAEGCSVYESQPPFGELMTALSEDRLYGDSHYAKAAIKARPDLTAFIRDMAGIDESTEDE